MRLATLGPHYTRAALHPGPAASWSFTPALHPPSLPRHHDPSSLCRHPALLPGTRACTCSRWPTGARGTAPRSTRTAGTCTAHAPSPPILTPQPCPCPRPRPRPRPRPPPPSLCRHCHPPPAPLHCAGIATSARGPTALQTPSRRRCERRACPAQHLHPARARTRRARASQRTQQPYTNQRTQQPYTNPHVRSPLRGPRPHREPPFPIPMVAGLLRQSGEGARAQGGAAGRGWEGAAAAAERRRRGGKAGAGVGSPQPRSAAAR